MSMSLNQKKYMGEKDYFQMKWHDEGSFDTKMHRQKIKRLTFFIY